MIRVQPEPFDPGVEIGRFAQDRHDIGGIATFVGLVRDNHEGHKVSAMTLEHYPGMTESQLEAIEKEAHQRWPLLDTLIIHRFGRMLPGEPIVLVATASSHRAAALDACAFLIDWLKTKAPFWKQEETPEGRRWVEARTADEEASAKWR